MELNVCKVIYDDIKLKSRDAEKMRGYIGNKYIENDLLHNHDENKFIYRYPLVQYKVLFGIPTIIGIADGATSVAKIGLLDDELVIKDNKYYVFQKQIIKSNEIFGVSEDYQEYEFVTPWISLSQKNIDQYRKGSLIEREEILKKILIGNIISMSKGLSYTVSKQLYCWIDLKEINVKLKGRQHIGFIGKFKVNFKIPNYFGIGKAVSRGFGVVKVLDN